MGFGSINDLLKKDATDKTVVNLNGPTQKFDQKMAVIAREGNEAEAQAKAGALGFPYINLENFPIGQEALKQIPRDLAEKLQTLCFFLTPDEIRLASVNPLLEGVSELFESVKDRNHAEGRVYVISEDSFAHALTLYDNLPTLKTLTKDIAITEEELTTFQADVTDFSSFQTVISKLTTTNLVVAILGAALKLDASDVHIENEAEQLVVRFRLDGVLHDAGTLPKTAAKQLVSRFKLNSSLKINIVDEPQDGRFTIKLAAYDVDVRVSTIPTVYGESVVMRLLRQTGQSITLDDLGIKGRSFDILKTEIARPNGMIIITGPTGSGKSTTLYAILTILNKPGVKIITLEDPVEYRVEGVNQSQIDHTKDYTFAKGLRSILRQDPDVVMVGEIRDLETADTAVQAALTGHLLLSTIHTNSAAGAVPRFLAMGVKPFLLAPALNCVIGQRLVRKLCIACRVPIALADYDDVNKTKIEKIINGLPPEIKTEYQNKQLYKAVGCDKCNNLGYKGRVAVCEIFVISNTIEKLLSAGTASEVDIAVAARAEGMLFMVEDGIMKALDGVTTVEEIFRVTE